jgi:threonine synthase
MSEISYLTHLSCSSCGKSFDVHKIQTFCPDCKAPLLANYDLKTARNKVDRDKIRYRYKGMWRWFELLPIFDPHQIISLGEGDTPLLPLTRIGDELGLSNLFVKEESLNPTGSFKARGLSASVSKASELGIKKITMPSAGNAGGALAAYAARAGITSLIYMPKSTPIANIIESQITGSKVELIDGLINDAGKYAQEMTDKHGWFNMSTFKEPYRVEGKKIMGYEIAEALSWHLPDVIIYPTGGGTGLVGMWKAFLELEALGWLQHPGKPRMVSVQAEGCAPVVKSFQSGLEKCELWENAHTIATGLCVPLSFADKLILKNIRESEGLAISVSDEEIIVSKDYFAKKEGIFTCPEGAATLAALRKLIDQKYIEKNGTVVLFNTGSGLKYLST